MSRNATPLVCLVPCAVHTRSAHALWRLVVVTLVASAVAGLTFAASAEPDPYEYARVRHQPISVNNLSAIADQPSRFLTQAVEFRGTVVGALRSEIVITVILKLDSGEIVHLRVRPEQSWVGIGEAAQVVARLAELPAETYVFDVLAMRPATPTPRPAEPRLQVHAAVSGVTMTVNGTSNMPNGTRLTCVVSARAPTIQGLLTGGPGTIDRRAVVEVRDGTWAAVFDLKGLGVAQLAVFVLLERRDLPSGLTVERTELEPLVAWDATVVQWAGDPAGEARQGRRDIVDHAAEVWYRTLVGERRAADAREEAVRGKEVANQVAAERAKKAEKAARMALAAVKVVRSWVTYNVIGNPEACIVVLNGTRKTLDAYEVRGCPIDS